MSRQRRTSSVKSINPIYYVFCEGETEEAYVSLIKQKFRFNIKIKSKVTGQKISEQFIRNYKKEIAKGVESPQDKTFLMYDVELLEIKNRLVGIKNAVYLFSNPNIELWFLLHFRDQHAFINSSSCISELIGFNSEYKKPKLNSSLEKVLENKFNEATRRAKNLTYLDNPSTTIYKLFEEIRS